MDVLVFWSCYTGSMRKFLKKNLIILISVKIGY